ncbi:MAG: septum formation initiator family protein [Hyphomonadaceae bacterium]
MRSWLPIGAILIILVLVGWLYKAKTDAVQTRAHIAELADDLKEERADVRELRAEVAHLESPERIEDLARENLDLEIGAEARAHEADEMDEALPNVQTRARRGQAKAE